MANKKISGYTEKTALDATDFYLIEQAAGTYRKMSSSRLTQVITSSVTYTIGSGGDFADFVQAMAYLKNKWILPDLKIILQQCSNLILVNPAAYTWSDGVLSAIYCNHPCASRIIFDLNGYNITVPAGVNCITSSSEMILNIINSRQQCYMLTSDGSANSCIFASTGSTIIIDPAYNIVIGASGQGFYNGAKLEIGSKLVALKLAIQYNNYGLVSNQAQSYIPSVFCGGSGVTGFYANNGSFIDRRGASGDDATNCSPAVGVTGNNNSLII